MFSFDPTEEQRMMVETVRRYAEEHLRRHFRDSEESGALPDGLVEIGWGLGLSSGNIPESFGGFGQHSALNAALCAEELGWGDLAAALYLLAPNLVALPVLEEGTEEQRRLWLPHFCRESFFPAAAALIEPRVRFEPANLSTKATPTGDGYLVNGTKVLVPLAREARLLLVYANEGGVTQGFLIEPDAVGVTIGEREKKMGLNALPTYEVTLANVRVGRERKLGGSSGIRFERLQNYSRVALAALGVGVARGAYEYAREYAKNREAFGEPIARRQAIAFMLAEMAIDIDAARLMVWEAAFRLDHGEDATREAYLAKEFAGDMALEVTDGAVQILGGHGYIRDYPVELWLRNGRALASIDGLAMV